VTTTGCSDARRSDARPGGRTYSAITALFLLFLVATHQLPVQAAGPLVPVGTAQERSDERVGTTPRRSADVATLTPAALLRPARQVRTIPRRRSVSEGGLPAPRAPDC